MLLAACLLAGCGGGKDEAATRQGLALVPAGGSTAAGDSTDLSAYDLDKEMAAVQKQFGANPTDLQGVLKEAEQTEPSEIRQESAAAVAVKQAPAQQAPALTGSGEFGLQLGSFRVEDRARSLADRLRELGHQPVIETAEVSGQIWQRVCLWDLSDKSAAIRLGERLHNELGTDYLVRQRPQGSR